MAESGEHTRRAAEAEMRVEAALRRGEEPSDVDIDATWGITPDMTPEQRKARIAELAARDEIAEDPAVAERAALEIRALREEEMFASQLGTRSFDTLPAAVRKLYRQNPNNPKIRALYDSVMQELYERTDDMMRGALLPAVDVMLDVMETGKDAERLKAATYVFERLRGKTPEVIEHRQDKPFQVMLERVVAGARIAPEAPRAIEAGQEPMEAEIVAETLSGPEAVELLRTGRFEDEDPYAEERALVENWDSHAG